MPETAPPPTIDPATGNPVPEGVPAKFVNEDGSVNVASLAQSYSALEQKLSSPEVAAGLVDPNATEQPETPAPSTPEQQADPFAGYREEYAANGDLSPESRAELEAKGFPPSVVDNYITGIKAQSELLTTRVHEAAGGKEQFEAIMQFAASGGLTPDEVNQWNEIVDSGDTAKTTLALEGIKAKYTAAQGGTSPKVTLQGGTSGSAIGFTDVAEYENFIANNYTRYKQDTAFRNAVDQRLAASSF